MTDDSLERRGPGQSRHASTASTYDYTPYRRSATPSVPSIDAELDGRGFGMPHTEVFLIASDALKFIEPSEHVSDARCLTHVFEPCLTPEWYSWPVYGVPVAVALGPHSLGIELRFIQKLRAFQPSAIFTHLNDGNGWHGPYHYDRFPALGLVA